MDKHNIKSKTNCRQTIEKKYYCRKVNKETNKTTLIILIMIIIMMIMMMMIIIIIIIIIISLTQI
jgi:hypothetical protein